MAFFQDARQHQPFLRVPVAVLLLIALLVVVYTLQANLVAPPGSGIEDKFAFVPALYSTHFMRAHYYALKSPLNLAIRFVSYIFLHAGWTHLLINSIWLLPFGSIVARRFGALLFLAFFLICGIAGAAAYLALNWGQPVAVLGASGAISGLMAAAFRLSPFPYAPDTDGKPLAPLSSRRILLWTAVWVVINVVAGLTGLGAGPGPQTIAWQVHLGGYFVGLFLTGPFLDARHRILFARHRRSAAT